MAIAEVGSGSQRASVTGDNVDSQALAFPAGVGNARLLIVAGSNFQSGVNATISVSDTLSTSYTVIQASLGASTVGFIAYGVSTSSGANTVTVNPSGTGNYVSYSIDEFSGQHATPLDVNGGSSTGTSTAPLDALTTGTANDLIIGLVTHSDGSSPTITPTGSYTQIGEEENTALHQPYNMVFRLVTTAQSYNVDWTTSPSTTWLALTAAFKEATSPKGLIMLLGDGGFL